jgi:hypothetical protein
VSAQAMEYRLANLGLVVPPDSFMAVESVTVGWPRLAEGGGLETSYGDHRG